MNGRDGKVGGLGFDAAREAKYAALRAYEAGEMGVYEAAANAGMFPEDFEEFAAGERGEL